MVSAMVIIMVGRVRNERENSCRAPWEIIPAMALNAYVEFPDLPKEESKAVEAISKQHQRKHRRGEIA